MANTELLTASSYPLRLYVVFAEAPQKESVNGKGGSMASIGFLKLRARVVALLFLERVS